MDIPLKDCNLPTSLIAKLQVHDKDPVLTMCGGGKLLPGTLNHLTIYDDETVL